MAAVQLEEIFAFRHAFDDIRQVRYTAAFPLREERLMAAGSDDRIDLFIELPFAFAKQRCCNIYFHSFSFYTDTVFTGRTAPSFAELF
jgi:hypothetical protein